MDKLVVVRWTKYGNDKLYVRTVGGYKVGELDRRTRVRKLDDGAWARAFDAAVAEFEARLGAPASPVTNAPSPAAEAPWVDLALNQPGQAVRAKAKELQEAAPVATFVARVVGVHTDERAWRLGDNGEVAVAKELERLNDRWRALHSVPVGNRGSDIDHVVIGPGGVFTVNSKNHPDARVWVRGDTVKINGNNQMHVRNSRHEAQRATQLLSEKVGFPVPVTGLVAVYGAATITIREQPRDGQVLVVGRREIATWLARRPPILDTRHLEAIYAAARRSTTWLANRSTSRRSR
jgi:nuclease-like protein